MNQDRIKSDKRNEKLKSDLMEMEASKVESENEKNSLNRKIASLEKILKNNKTQSKLNDSTQKKLKESEEVVKRLKETEKHLETAKNKIHELEDLLFKNSNCLDQLEEMREGKN